MNELLLELQMVSGSAPGLVLPELAERLVAHLREVDLCRVEVIIEGNGGAAVSSGGGGAAAGGGSAGALGSSGGGGGGFGGAGAPAGAPADGAAPAASVLLAAHGVGAAVCEETPVVRREAGHSWAALQRRSGGFGGTAMYVADAEAPGAAGAEPLPGDFEALRARAGLRSFLAVLIAAGGRVVGCLTVAALRPGAFAEQWWQPVLTMSGTALLPHLRNRQLVGLCRALVAVDAEADAAAAASLAVHGVAAFMRATTNLAMAVRLGLVRDGRVLIIEQDPHAGEWGGAVIWTGYGDFGLGRGEMEPRRCAPRGSSPAHLLCPPPYPTHNDR